MKWLREDDIRAFLAFMDYDVRKSGNARWIDQKCTPDVLSAVADCVLHHAESRPEQSFSTSDVWHDTYTVGNIESIYKKPNPNENKARHEYDKFFQQPMKLLACAGVLREFKHGRENRFALVQPDILQFLAMGERNALQFLTLYIEKVLRDSGLYGEFEQFFAQQSKQAYERLKDTFTAFTIEHTPINGQTECWRIFIKVLNPLAYRQNSRGTERGRLSRRRITYDMLMYNRENFRDRYADKPKDLTRSEHAVQAAAQPDDKLWLYQSQKAKARVRAFNDTYRGGRSEVPDPRHDGDRASHIHHIFPRADFPEIGMYPENLIALTPTQHLDYAHPDGNTARIDPAFQKTCLLAKVRSVRDNLRDPMQPQMYDFGLLLRVAATGLQDSRFLSIEPDDYDTLCDLLKKA